MTSIYHNVLQVHPHCFQGTDQQGRGGGSGAAATTGGSKSAAEPGCSANHGPQPAVPEAALPDGRATEAEHACWVQAAAPDAGRDAAAGGAAAAGGGRRAWGQPGTAAAPAAPGAGQRPRGGGRRGGGQGGGAGWSQGALQGTIQI